MAPIWNSSGVAKAAEIEQDREFPPQLRLVPLAVFFLGLGLGRRRATRSARRSRPSSRRRPVRRGGRCPGSTRTSARSMARLTLASTTPGTWRRAFSTRVEQALQVMPSMGKEKVSVGTSKPALTMASAMAGTARVAGS